MANNYRHKDDMAQVYHGNRLNQQLDMFEQHLPKKPYHTDDLRAGLTIRSMTTAKLARYIQPNGPTHKRHLVFDLDHAGAVLAWDQKLAPPPTLIVENPVNGHAHAIYTLDTPVRVAYNANIAPLRYAAAIEQALMTMLDADIGYSGLICKNPLHKYWNVHTFAGSYSLGLLHEYLDLKQAANDAQKPAQSDLAYGLGRNCTLFDETRLWAYRAIRQGWPDYDRWLMAVTDRALMLNQRFSAPLCRKEVGTIAKSIAKWTYKNFSERQFNLFVANTHTPEIQSKRGVKGGKKSGEVRRAGSITEQKPWEAEGVSRATWYRRQQAQAKA